MISHSGSQIENRLCDGYLDNTSNGVLYTFACTVASFINEDWELIERVIDFKPLEDKEHEGLYGGCKMGCFDKISVSKAHMTCCSSRQMRVSREPSIFRGLCIPSESCSLSPSAVLGSVLGISSGDRAETGTVSRRHNPSPKSL